MRADSCALALTFGTCGNDCAEQSATNLPPFHKQVQFGQLVRQFDLSRRNELAGSIVADAVNMITKQINTGIPVAPSGPLGARSEQAEWPGSRGRFFTLRRLLICSDLVAVLFLFLPLALEPQLASSNWICTLLVVLSLAQSHERHPHKWRAASSRQEKFEWPRVASGRDSRKWRGERIGDERRRQKQRGGVALAPCQTPVVLVLPDEGAICIHKFQLEFDMAPRRIARKTAGHRVAFGRRGMLEQF